MKCGMKICLKNDFQLMILLKEVVVNIKMWHLMVINVFATSCVYLVEGLSLKSFDGILGFFGELFLFNTNNISSGYKLRLVVYILESFVTIMLIPFIFIFGVLEFRKFNSQIHRWIRLCGLIFYISISWLAFPVLFFLNNSITDGPMGFFVLAPVIFTGVQVFLGMLRNEVRG